MCNKVVIVNKVFIQISVLFVIVLIELNVLQAEERIRKQSMDKEYSPIAGNAEFCKHSIKLALGDCSDAVDNGLVRIVHSEYFPITYCKFETIEHFVHNIKFVRDLNSLHVSMYRVHQ